MTLLDEIQANEKAKRQLGASYLQLTISLAWLLECVINDDTQTDTLDLDHAINEATRVLKEHEKFKSMAEQMKSGKI